MSGSISSFLDKSSQLLKKIDENQDLIKANEPVFFF